MAKIPKPKNTKRTKGTPPKETISSENLHKPTSEQKVALNFLVASDFRKSLKAYALENDVSMVELLRRMFEFYKENH